MKKTFALAIAIALLLALTGCGVPQSTHDDIVYEHKKTIASLEKLEGEYDYLETKYEELLAEKEKIESDYSILYEETADWRFYDEEKKATELAQAQADKIVAEEAEKKAKEEKAKAEAKAKEEAEKKAAEEAERKAEEEKKGYETGITYDQLARNPEKYKGKKVKFTGEVLQVSEIKTEIQIRLATKASQWGGYSENVLYIYFDKSLVDSRILEDDIITIYGVAMELHSYESVLGNKITLPLIEVEKIDWDWE